MSAPEGVVTLEREVDSLAQRWAVERAVRRVAGVTDVNESRAAPDRRATCQHRVSRGPPYVAAKAQDIDCASVSPNDERFGCSDV